MTKLFKKILSLTLTLLTIASLCTGIFAAEGDSYLDMGTKEYTYHEINTDYTTSDLFNNFKDVMPGDKRSQTIILTNKTEAEFLSLTLYGVEHGTDNPINPDVAATWQDEQNSLTDDDILEKMKDFLKLMEITIYKDNANGERLFFGTADTIIGTGIFLGEITDELTLYVTLDVSTEMSNEYANKAGEIDWRFDVKGVNKNSLTVLKVWKDNGYKKRPDSITVTLYQTDRNGGDPEKFNTITLRKENNWTHTWTNLSDEFIWSVEEDGVPDKYTVSYDTTEEGVVKITNFYDYKPPVIPWYPQPNVPDPRPQPPETEPDETEPEETEPEETKPEETEPEETEPPVIEEPEVRDLTVVKTWAEDKAEDRPTSVTVALYNSEVEVEKVVLGDWNNWSYTWCDLDANEQWCVLEVDIPLGYTPSYAAEGDTVTITNQASLIQTGQLNWPIPVLCGVGVLLVGGGVLLLRKKKENEDA